MTQERQVAITADPWSWRPAPALRRGCWTHSRGRTSGARGSPSWWRRRFSGQMSRTAKWFLNTIIQEWISLALNCQWSEPSKARPWTGLGDQFIKFSSSSCDLTDLSDGVMRTSHQVRIGKARDTTIFQKKNWKKN